MRRGGACVGWGEPQLVAEGCHVERILGRWVESSVEVVVVVAATVAAAGSTGGSKRQRNRDDVNTRLGF